MNVVFFLLGHSPASGFCVQKFQNTLSAPSSYVVSTRRPTKMEQCSETSASKLQMPGNHPKKKTIQQDIICWSVVFGYSSFTCLLPTRVTFSNLWSINTHRGCTRTRSREHAANGTVTQSTLPSWEWQEECNPSVVLLESPLHIHFCTCDFGISPDVTRRQSTLHNDRLQNL